MPPIRVATTGRPSAMGSRTAIGAFSAHSEGTTAARQPASSRSTSSPGSLPRKRTPAGVSAIERLVEGARPGDEQRDAGGLDGAQQCDETLLAREAAGVDEGLAGRHVRGRLARAGSRSARTWIGRLDAVSGDELGEIPAGRDEGVHEAFVAHAPAAPQEVGRAEHALRTVS